MRKDSIVYWIKNIFELYVKWIHNLLGYDARCVFITDCCTSHNMDEVIEAYEKTCNIKVIFLPAHSSHFTQKQDDLLLTAKCNLISFPILKNSKIDQS